MAVEKEIENKNHWYIDDQYLNQLGTSGPKSELEKRWQNFYLKLTDWWENQNQKTRQTRVLDAGCGDGINLSVLETFFAKKRMSISLTACDYNPLRLSRLKKARGIKVVEASLLNLPFKDDFFDVILCSHVIEHIKEDVSALREIKRILNPNGLLIVAVPNEGCLMARLRNSFFQKHILETTDHVNFYTDESLVEIASQAGLTLDGKVLHEGFFIPHLGVHTRLREYKLWQVLISILSKFFPSQAAGLVASFKK